MLVLLSKRSVNHGLEVAVDIPVHDFLQCFLISLVNSSGLTSGLQPVDDQLYAEVGWLISAPFFKVINIVSDGLNNTIGHFVLKFLKLTR